MSSDDDGLTSGPAAWMIMATLVAVVIGLAAWSYAGFQATTQLADALALASDDERVELLAALDLMAQQRMATAAIVAVVLSAISAIMLAGTVWFTLDASRQSRRSAEIAQAALNEARATSRRELMPHIAGEVTIKRIVLPFSFDLQVTVSNFGKTPCHLKEVNVSSLFEQEKLPVYTVFRSGVILEPNGSFTRKSEFLCNKDTTLRLS